ncbi:ankyrin repeat domain-containing protein 2 [Chanos chanos]|uniref:Ankyrin repeat domain-containing protein 2 n=1 Tax=Chanos chanos TaxID=29144 RepID=A0A6J2VAQ5_CHACN|nr:ankyrin repeat domain-containing protein 2 [Chanos chanos]
MDEDVLWATTTVIDRRAVLDKKEERRQARARKLGVLRVNISGQELMKRDDSLSQNVADIQVEERVRKTSSDLRCEIIDLGGAKNVSELRRRKKTRKKEENNSRGKVDIPAVNTLIWPVDTADFLKAATEGNLKVIEMFLENGGDPNICDEFRKTALHRASLEGHVKIVELLLDKGADINFKDRLDCRAVHWACRGGSLGALKVLQSRGADLNVRDTLMSTPLHVATRTGHCNVVERLLASGIKMNAKDWEGDTALHDAVRLNRYKIVKLLILAGADMKIKNAEGITATEQVKLWQFDTKETLEKLEQMMEVA